MTSSNLDKFSTLQRQIRRLQKKLSSILDKILCNCHTHAADKYSVDDRVTKLRVHWLVNRFQQTGPVEDCQHNNSGNFKKGLNVSKTQSGRHITDLVSILISESHYHFFVN